MSPALAGGFLTTEPPETSPKLVTLIEVSSLFIVGIIIDIFEFKSTTVFLFCFFPHFFFTPSFFSPALPSFILINSFTTLPPLLLAC